MMAQVFRNLLRHEAPFAHGFEHIVFAVLDRRGTALEAFTAILT